jgi:hypothetical protein
MTEAKEDRRKWRTRAIWLTGGLLVAIALATSIMFAMNHTNGSSGPSDIPPGNVQPQSGVLVSDECGNTNDEGLYEPGTIQLTCGDGTIEANGLTWSQWGSETATGHGSINEVSCVPNCADGKDVEYQANLMLSQPVKARNGKEYFTRVAVSFVGNGPNGSSGQLFKDCYYSPPAPYIPQCPANKKA